MADPNPQSNLVGQDCQGGFYDDLAFSQEPKLDLVVAGGANNLPDRPAPLDLAAKWLAVRLVGTLCAVRPLPLLL